MVRNPYAPPEAPVDDPAMPHMVRPKQVSTAVTFLWTSLGLGFISSALQWEYLTSIGGVGFAIAVQVLTFCITGWLTYKISSGRNWARIVFTVLAVVGLPSIAALPGIFERSPAAAVIIVIQWLLQLSAIYLIFSEPGRNWFRRRAAGGKVAA